MIITVFNSGFDKNKDASTHLCCFSDRLITGKDGWKYLLYMPALFY